eukprot:scaffold4.g4665.t1
MEPPGVNQIMPPSAVLKVEGIPSYVVPVDFTRLFTQLDGCLGARLLGGQPGREQVGYAEFSDKMNAVKARNLYQGYGGYGGRGFSITLVDSQTPIDATQPQLAAAAAPGQKRLREGDAYQPEAMGYKQLRADAGLVAQSAQQLLAGGVGLPQQVPGYAPQQQAGYMPAPAQLPAGASNGRLLVAGGPGGPAAQQGGAYAPQQLAGQQQPGVRGPLDGQYVPQPVAAQQPAAGAGYVLPSQQQQPLQVQQPQYASLQQQAPQQGGVYALPPQPTQGGAYALAPQQQQQQPPPQYAGVQQQAPQQGSYAPAPQGYAPAPQQQPPQQPQQQPLLYQPAPQLQAGAYLPAPVAAPPPQQAYAAPPAYGAGPPGGLGSGPLGQGPGPELAGPRGGGQQYPPDACPTLYCDSLPEDVTRRELAHIFRHYPGFEGLRLVIKDSKKRPGEKLGYQFDLDSAEPTPMYVKYARPLERPHEYFSHRRRDRFFSC